MHIFHKSLKQGQVGEESFMRLYPHKLIRLDGKIADFELENGDTIELKSDSYSIERTPNFFMERWSDIDKGKPGGPWQALEKDIKYYIYYFPINQKYFTFETKILVSRLNSIINNNELQPVQIPNIKWTTVGFKVPRVNVQEIVIEEN